MELHKNILENGQKIYGCDPGKEPSAVYLAPEHHLLEKFANMNIFLCRKRERKCLYFGEPVFDSGICRLAAIKDEARYCSDKKSYSSVLDYFFMNKISMKSANLPVCNIGKNCKGSVIVLNRNVCLGRALEQNQDLERVLSEIGVNGNPEDFVIEPLKTVYIDMYLGTASNKKKSHKTNIQ